MGLTSLSFPFLLEAQAVTAKKREWAMAWKARLRFSPARVCVNSVRAAGLNYKSPNW